MVLTDSDVCLPRERSESRLVAADNSSLSNIAMGRVEAAPGVILDRAKVKGRPVLVVL